LLESRLFLNEIQPNSAGRSASVLRYVQRRLALVAICGASLTVHKHDNVCVFFDFTGLPEFRQGWLLSFGLSVQLRQNHNGNL
jgi:hypothetical protein